MIVRLPPSNYHVHSTSVSAIILTAMEFQVKPSLCYHQARWLAVNGVPLNHFNGKPPRRVLTCDELNPSAPSTFQLHLAVNFAPGANF